MSDSSASDDPTKTIPTTAGERIAARMAAYKPDGKEAVPVYFGVDSDGDIDGVIVDDGKVDVTEAVTDFIMGNMTIERGTVYEARVFLGMPWHLLAAHRSPAAPSQD